MKTTQNDNEYEIIYAHLNSKKKNKGNQLMFK